MPSNTSMLPKSSVAANSSEEQQYTGWVNSFTVDLLAVSSRFLLPDSFLNRNSKDLKGDLKEEKEKREREKESL